MFGVFGSSVRVLVDQEYKFTSYLTGESITLYGNPRTCLYTFAFSHLSGLKDISDIPEGIDILVTHESPRDYSLGCIKRSMGWYGNDEPGNLALFQRVKEISPKYHVFGHIHHSCQGKVGDTVLMNVSQMNADIISPELFIIDYE